MRYSVRLLWIGWLRNCRNHVAEALQKVVCRIRCENEPAGNDSNGRANGLLGSGFLWQGANGTYGYSEGGPVELNTNELIAKYLRRQVVVANTEFHFLNQQNLPQSNNIDLAEANAKMAGILVNETASENMRRLKAESKRPRKKRAA